MNAYLQIHPDDNVLVALQDIPVGTDISFNGHNIQLQQNISAKHKFLINDIDGLENPTAENITVWIWNTIKPLLSNLSKVQLYETPTTGVIYSSD